MSGDTLSRECAELHAYLCEQIGHNWRLPTWRDKYAARIKRYGLAACKIAADGFRSSSWYMDNCAANAPDLIFRSDKQFEKFFAIGERLPGNSPESREHEQHERKRATRITETRTRLENDQSVMNARMRVKLAYLEDEISDAAYRAFIDPLLYVKYEHGVCYLYHEQAKWVMDHYLVLIERALGTKVQIVDNLTEGMSK